jgi:anthraniloyl-CoA monooxygenase
VHSTRLAAQAGFDWLELHCAHGYLLSSFISPLTNQRTDDYGGPLANRLRYPLEVFRAMRAAWPDHLPMAVRISAHDWVEGGITPDDAVEIARAFKAAGADMIDCSSGQVSRKQQPVYGRMYQTPFADRIRNEAGIPTIAVGAISEADHVNSIIAAGRAALCAIARPHLANPAWTLLEAAKVGCHDLPWPKQYRSAKTQLERNLEREKAAAAQSAGLSPLEQARQAVSDDERGEHHERNERAGRPRTGRGQPPAAGGLSPPDVQPDAGRFPAHPGQAGANGDHHRQLGAAGVPGGVAARPGPDHHP